MNPLHWPGRVANACFAPLGELGWCKYSAPKGQVQPPCGHNKVRFVPAIFGWCMVGWVEDGSSKADQVGKGGAGTAIRQTDPGTRLTGLGDLGQIQTPVLVPIGLIYVALFWG